MTCNLLSVVIPVYNESATLLTLLSRVEAVDLPFSVEIVLVDDASTDGSRQLIESLAGDQYVKVFHEENQGKGAALQSPSVRVVVTTLIWYSK